MTIKKAIIIVVSLFVVAFLAWIVIINVKEDENSIKIEEKTGKTLYHVYDLYYQEVDDSDTIVIDTNKGVMIAELYPSGAPITVANFKKLVGEKFYDGITFHRVIKDFMIQGGDPTGTGNGGSDNTIKGEFSINGYNNTLSHTRGVLSMARAGSQPETPETMNSASSQFFIVHKDSKHLDGNYASFGMLLYGYDVLDKIANTQTDENDKPLTDQVINKIRFVSIYEE